MLNILVTPAQTNIEQTSTISPLHSGQPSPHCVGVVPLRLEVGVEGRQLDVGLLDGDPLGLVPPPVGGLERDLGDDGGHAGTS